MKRNALSSRKARTPSLTAPALQNLLLASLASFITRACSITLTAPMYHEPIDMMIRMIKVTLATIDSAATTATTRILTSNPRLFILVLCKSLDFPVVVDARPGALRPAVDRRRPELACSQRGPCRLIQAAIAGGALDLALQHPAVHIDEKAQPHDAPFVRAQRGRRIRRLLASPGVDDRRGALGRRRRRRNPHRRRRLHHGGAVRRSVHPDPYMR